MAPCPPAVQNEIQFEQDTLNLASGESEEFQFIVSVESQNNDLDIILVSSITHDFLTVALLDTSSELFELDGNTILVPTVISASSDALPGTYKILLGTQSGDVTISKFLTVIIE